MLTDQSLPKYREIHSLLNELYEIVAKLEERSAKANKLLMENRLTEEQKKAYDILTKELAVLKNSEKVMAQMATAYDRLVKVDPQSAEWQELYQEFINSNNI